MKRNFEKDVTVLWEKIQCPLCGNVTGNEGDCYSDRSPQMLSTPNGLVPIFSTSCIFRTDNLWKLHLNYVVSYALLERINKIDGVKKCFPLDKYSMQIAIGRLFDEKIVQSTINQTCRTFIKEMQALEASLMESQKTQIGVKLPNGSEFIVKNNNISDLLLVEEISNSIEGASPIKKDLKNSKAEKKIGD